jgi:hypothetical protein
MDESKQYFKMQCNLSIGVTIRQYSDCDNTISHDHYSLKLPAYSDIKQNNGKEQHTSMTTTPNMILLRKDTDTYACCNVVISNHYITAKHKTNTNNGEDTISIFYRGHGDKLNTINIPKNSKIYEIKGKWTSLTKVSQDERKCNDEGVYEDAYVCVIT